MAQERIVVAEDLREATQTRMNKDTSCRFLPSDRTERGEQQKATEVSRWREENDKAISIGWVEHSQQNETFDEFVMILCGLDWSMPVADIQAEKGQFNRSHSPVAHRVRVTSLHAEEC